MATQKQINAIVYEMKNRGLITAQGKLVEGWGHDVGTPLPAVVKQYHDEPAIAFADLDNNGVSVMFKKLSI